MCIAMDSARVILDSLQTAPVAPSPLGTPTIAPGTKAAASGSSSAAASAGSSASDPAESAPSQGIQVDLYYLSSDGRSVRPVSHAELCGASAADIEVGNVAMAAGEQLQLKPVEVSARQGSSLA